MSDVLTGVALKFAQRRTFAAPVRRPFPAHGGPGPAEIGVVEYIDRALASAEQGHCEQCRIRPDRLPSANQRVDCDPTHRDRTGLGLLMAPSATYELSENERHLAGWAEVTTVDLLSAMWPARTARGPRFSGGSSHNMGGCRVGHNAAISVVEPDALEVYETRGLHVSGGAVHRTSPEINLTLAIWAAAHRAAGRLVARLAEDREYAHG